MTDSKSAAGAKAKAVFDLCSKPSKDQAAPTITSQQLKAMKVIDFSSSNEEEKKRDFPEIKFLLAERTSICTAINTVDLANGKKWTYEAFNFVREPSEDDPNPKAKPFIFALKACHIDRTIKALLEVQKVIKNPQQAKAWW